MLEFVKAKGVHAVLRRSYDLTMLGREIRESPYIKLRFRQTWHSTEERIRT